jgi:hypothetical protein
MIATEFLEMHAHRHTHASTIKFARIDATKHDGSATFE